MKLRTFLFGFIALSFIVSLFAAEPSPRPGQYGQEVLEQLKESGIVKLNGTTIDKELHVSGCLIAQNAKIGTLDIAGSANLTNTIVKNSSHIIGSLQAVRSTFESSLTVLAQKVVFTNTKLEGITIQRDVGFKGKQIIELRQRTIVKGPIVFESGKGEVLLYPGSQIHGAVIGGQVVKKS